MRPRAGSVLSCGRGVVLACAVVGAFLAQSALSRAEPAMRATGASSVVPLVVCPTSFGVPPDKRAAFPAVTSLAAPTTLSLSLAAYTDTQGYMTLIAPKGWKCSAMYGADGSGGLRVYPGGSASAHEGIVGGETSACFGCTVAQACGLFPDALRAYRSAFPGPCPSRRPASETVSRLSATVVAFEDPAYVKGEGALSGGAFPANGVVTYSRGNDYGSWIETCTLPDNVHSTCTAVLNDFVARYRSR